MVITGNVLNFQKGNVILKLHSGWVMNGYIVIAEGNIVGKKVAVAQGTEYWRCSSIFI